MKTEQKFSSCAIDSDNLDDWLESDLRQSGILPFDSNVNNPVKHEMDDSSEILSCGGGSDDKTIVGQVDTPALAPILKALVALNSLHQEGSILPSHHVPAPLSPPLLIYDAINPLYMIKSPPALTKRNNANISPRPIQQQLPLTGEKRPQSVDTLDPVTLKRIKNTDAARRSRLRKAMKMEGLESRVNELEKINQQLLFKVTEAEQQRDDAKLKESSQREKVLALETELALAQKSLGSHAPSNKKNHHSKTDT